MTERQNSSDSQNLIKNFETECSDSPYDKSCSKTAFGVSLIPGTGNLLEFGGCESSCTSCSGTCSTNRNGISSCICNDNFCPRSYTGCLTIDNCCKFSAFKKINFIDGDVIITDGNSFDNCSFPTCNGVTLSLTEAIDIFPCLRGINGNLYIINSVYSKITGFKCLRWVTGNIIIANNKNLVCIPSFPALVNIGGIVCGGKDKCPCDNPSPDCNNVPPTMDCCGRIEKNSWEPVDLNYCSSFLAIAQNPSLRKISGFEQLRQVNDGIFIVDNASLNSIAGFIYLYRTDRIVIKGNANLNKIIGFCYVDTLNVGLFILENNLSSGYDLVLGAFVSLESANKIVICNNNGLKTITFNSLTNVCDEFVVAYNKNLTDLTANVKHVGDFSIHDNAITCLKLPLLTEINGGFLFAREQLKCFDTLEELKRVGKSFVIVENNQLTEFNGANKLKYIGDDYTALLDIIPAPCTNTCDSNIPSSSVSWLLVTDSTIGCSGSACTSFITVLDNGCGSSNQTIPSPDSYDYRGNDYGYTIPKDFFYLLCNKGTNNTVTPISPPNLISASIIFYGNAVLKCISGFFNLRHMKSNLYIVGNKCLHTISSFGNLVFVLDVWIRNNINLKFVIGFNRLMACRDFLILDSLIKKLDGFSGLEFAQRIVAETKSIKSYNNNKLIQTTCGYITYAKFDDVYDQTC